MRRLQREDLENQHVQRALRNRKSRRWHQYLNLRPLRISRNRSKDEAWRSCPTQSQVFKILAARTKQTYLHLISPHLTAGARKPGVIKFLWGGHSWPQPPFRAATPTQKATSRFVQSGLLRTTPLP